MKKLFRSTSLGILSILYFFTPKNVFSAKTIGDADTALNATMGRTGLSTASLVDYTGSIAGAIFGILGLIFFILTAYAGVQWFLARGEEEKITKARNTLIAGIIGLFIAVAAYAIANFVTSAVLGTP